MRQVLIEPDRDQVRVILAHGLQELLQVERLAIERQGPLQLNQTQGAAAAKATTTQYPPGSCSEGVISAGSSSARSRVRGNPHIPAQN